MDQPPGRDIEKGGECDRANTSHPLLYAADGNPIDHQQPTATPDKDHKPTAANRWPGAAFWQAVFSGFLVITTIVHAYYYSRQWEAMEGQLAVARKATEVAIKTLRSYEASFEVSNRPYVTVYKARLVRPLKVGERIRIEGQIRNGGATPAFRSKATIAVVFVDVREPLTFEPPGHDISPTPPSDIPSNLDRALIFTTDNPMPEELIAAVAAKTHVLYFYGDYTYASLTKTYGPFRFCFFDDPFFHSDGALSVCNIEKYDRTGKSKAKHKY